MSDYTPFKGEIVWNELFTRDIDKAVEFYTKLFGWTVQEMTIDGQNYMAFGYGEEMLGGFVPLEQSGQSSYWIMYNHVENVDETGEIITRLGGKVVYGPETVPTIGTWIIAQDQYGATFSPFKFENPGGFTKPQQGAGRFCWYDVLTVNAEKAKDFYYKVFGWTAQDVPAPEGGTYTLLKNGDTEVAGLMAKQPDDPRPAHWLTYIATENITKSIEKAKNIGGKLFFGPTDIPGYGKIATLQDPTGATFALFELNKG